MFAAHLCLINKTTADSLLAKKANKHLLQDFDLRRAAAVDFMGLVRPGLAIAGGALCDPQVQRLFVVAGI